MSACEGLKKIALYHDDRLPLSEREAVEAHLLVCPDCAAELGELESLSRQFESARLPGASHTLVDRLHSEANELDRILLTRFVSRLTAISAAVLFAGGICVALIGQGTAHPAATLASWEQSAIAPQLNSSDAGTENQFVEFVAQDLSGGRP